MGSAVLMFLSQLDFVVRLLLHYNKSPSASAVPPPPGRTSYAADHLLRKLRATYATNSDDYQGEVAGAKTPKSKSTPKANAGKRKAEASDDSPSKKAKESVKDEDVEEEMEA